MDHQRRIVSAIDERFVFQVTDHSVRYFTAKVSNFCLHFEMPLLRPDLELVIHDGDDLALLTDGLRAALIEIPAARTTKRVRIRKIAPVDDRQEAVRLFDLYATAFKTAASDTRRPVKNAFLDMDRLNTFFDGVFEL
ncbi:hypothetical protein [Neotabrizicola sp. sgz301269]|uniref:hypothetical protein n=1 Tax=Neotabrizicola sp. sgz301269 TaxID=3276282 RepID=UPI00376F9CD9